MNRIQQRIQRDLRVKVTGGHVYAPCEAVYLWAYQGSGGLKVALVSPDGCRLFSVEPQFVQTINDIVEENDHA